MYGLFVALLMIGLIWLIYETVLSANCPELEEMSFVRAFILGGVVGIGITLLTYQVALFLISYFFQKDHTWLGYAVTKTQGKGKLYVLILVIFLMFVGGGYAVANITENVVARLVGYIGGVAVLEELSKAATGLYLYHKYFKTYKNGLFVSLAIAGFGFGTGEALFYFFLYADTHIGISIYFMRGLVVAPLHGVWTVLLLLPGQKKLTKIINDGQIRSSVPVLIVCCATPVLLHGIYNTFASYSNLFYWAIIVVSFYLLTQIESEYDVS